MMDKDIMILKNEDIKNKIYTIRGLQIMLDSDLAKLYQVETRVFNQAVKRNITRFPERFRFQLTENEFDEIKKSLRSQNVILENQRGKHRKYMPYVFTEQGISMLSAVLKSDIAIDVSIKIIDSFVNMRKFISQNADIFKRLDLMEKRQISFEIKTEDKFDNILNALEDKTLKPKQGIFFEGQMFDAYVFVADLIKSANKSIVLIDNYVDETVLTLLSKRDSKCSATIYTKKLTKQLKLDLEKHNSQYPPIEIKELKEAHDRFLILDEKNIYHIGASLKDLGKKWFAFSKFETGAIEILGKLNN
ncbi:MAG: ORF6N domain-containing protein [Psychrilyobacter sp.]|uniref:ORF6N domain-containing protein n=1 Tax=Psychrilyobacter sp. TaxID=2586924 RepID=UPI003C792BEC